MSPEQHQTVPVESNPEETVFECIVEGCDRRLVLNRKDMRLTVLVEGDREAQHHGASGLVTMGASVIAGRPTG